MKQMSSTMFAKGVLLVLGVLILPGCATRRYRFEGVGADGSTGREVRYVLRSDEGQEGSIAISTRGRAYDEVGNRETDTLRVQIVVDNLSDDDVVIPLGPLALQDDAGRRWQRIGVEASHPVDEVLSTPPGVRHAFDVEFDAGAPGGLRTTGSVTLQWMYRFRGQDFPHESRFLPIRVERESYPAHFGFSYGRGWYGPGWGWGGYGAWGPAWCW